MPDDAKVKIKLDENGKVVGIDVEGDIDRDNLTEERPSKDPNPLNTDEFLNHQSTRWFG